MNWGYLSGEKSTAAPIAQKSHRQFNASLSQAEGDCAAALSMKPYSHQTAVDHAAGGQLSSDQIRSFEVGAHDMDHNQYLQQEVIANKAYFGRNTALAYVQSSTNMMTPVRSGILRSQGDASSKAASSELSSGSSKSDMLSYNSVGASWSPDTVWAGSDCSGASFSTIERSPSFDLSSDPLSVQPSDFQFSQDSLNYDMSGLPINSHGLAVPYPNQIFAAQQVGYQQGAVSHYDWGYNGWMGSANPFGVSGTQDSSQESLMDRSFTSVGQNGMGSAYEQERKPVSFDSANHTTTLASVPRLDPPQNRGTGAGGVTAEVKQPPPGSSLQRTREDRILLEGKAKGLTYKQIRKQLKSNIAESTLRGRYRSLTKKRKDRVRKPIWTDRDVRLLKDIVNAELRRSEEPGCRSLCKAQRLAKLSWKKIAEYIVLNGGSYHFGNSTCKKKWGELMEDR